MKVYAKQGGHRFLVITDGDPATRSGVGVVVDCKAKTVERVKNVPLVMRQASWKPITPSDPTPEELAARVPAFRPYRGIEIRLSTGETAWVRWREWWSKSQAAQKRLTEATRALAIPAYEPDGDYFLAVHAAAVLGGEVLDTPRAVAPPLGDAY